MENQERQKNKIEWVKILCSALLVILIGIFNFLWSLSMRFTIMEERDKEHTESINEIQQKSNTSALAIQDVRERMIRLEAQIKSNN